MCLSDTIQWSDILSFCPPIGFSSAADGKEKKRSINNERLLKVFVFKKDDMTRTT